MSITALTAALATFNLICTGTLTSPLGSKPSNTTYRVDLEAQRYCFDDCTETLPIQVITDRQIIFLDQKYEDGGSHRRTVNRESGRLHDQVIIHEKAFKAEMTTVATCYRAPFEGFPSRRF